LRQLALVDWRKMFEKLSKVERLLRLDPSGIGMVYSGPRNMEKSGISAFSSAHWTLSIRSSRPIVGSEGVSYKDRH
jgi:hypothetical protein